MAAALKNHWKTSEEMRRHTIKFGASARLRRDAMSRHVGSSYQDKRLNPQHLLFTIAWADFDLLWHFYIDTFDALQATR